MRTLAWLITFGSLLGWSAGLGASPGSRAGPAESSFNGLQLEVDATLDDMLTSDGTDWKWSGATLRIEVALRNASGESITVPTTAFDEAPRVAIWPAAGPAEERIVIAIDAVNFRGGPAVFAWSRLSPVAIEPGEVALILQHRAFIPDRVHADSIKEAVMSFVVSTQLRGAKGWWRGSLVTRAEIKRSSDPDLELARSNRAAKQDKEERSDPNFIRHLPVRLAEGMAHADRIVFQAEGGAKREDRVVRDPAIIGALSEEIAKVTLSERVACLCSGWRSAEFYHGDTRLVSIAAIHGHQLRLGWEGSGGDFPVGPEQWDAISAKLDAAYEESERTAP